MGTLLDTGFLYGLKDENDPHHERAVELLSTLQWRELSPIITSSLVINETYTLLMYRSKGNKALVNKLDELCWGDECFFRIVNIPTSEFQKIASIMTKYASPKKLLSFVDASLIFLAQNKGYDQVISFDGHFDGIIPRIC